MRCATRFVAALAAVAVVGYASAASAASFPASLTLSPSTSVALSIKLNGTNILVPATQNIPLTSGSLTMDVEQSPGAVPPPLAISNVSGLLADGAGLYVANPWNINTLLGPLVITGGHLSVGVGPGPYAIVGGQADLSGMNISLDGGTGSILGNAFDFGADPVDFALPGGTLATVTESGVGPVYNIGLSIPVNVQGDTIVDLGGTPATLSYIIQGNIVFTGTKVVPEPATLAMLGMGAIGLVAIGRRRIRKA